MDIGNQNVYDNEKFSHNENVNHNRNLHNNENLRKISTIFFTLTSITLVLNLILFFKNKNFYEKLILGGGVITEIIILFSIYNKDQDNLSTLHQWFLVLGILGSLFFDKIYLIYIIYLLLMAFLTREIFGYCFFEPYEKKTHNGTLTFFVIMSIIITRLFFQKLHKDLIKF